MTINFSPELEKIIETQANQLCSTPESIVVDALRDKFFSLLPVSEANLHALNDRKLRLRQLASHCGVSLSDQALSSDGLYD